MPLTQLNNRENITIEIPAPHELERTISAKNAVTGAQVYHRDLDPYESPSFPVIIDSIPCTAGNVQIYTTNVDIDFIVAEAWKLPATERAIYFFVLYRNEYEVWQVGDDVVLSHNTDTDEGFYGLKPSEQLRLLGR